MLSRGRKPESEPPGQHSRKKKNCILTGRNLEQDKKRQRDVFREPDSVDFSVWHLPIDAPAQGQIIR